jgi:hypothetical protein
VKSLNGFFRSGSTVGSSRSRPLTREIEGCVLWRCETQPPPPPPRQQYCVHSALYPTLCLCKVRHDRCSVAWLTSVRTCSGELSWPVPREAIVHVLVLRGVREWTLGIDLFWSVLNVCLSLVYWFYFTWVSCSWLAECYNEININTSELFVVSTYYCCWYSSIGPRSYIFVRWLLLTSGRSFEQIVLLDVPHYFGVTITIDV